MESHRIRPYNLIVLRVNCLTEGRVLIERNKNRDYICFMFKSVIIEIVFLHSYYNMLRHIRGGRNNENDLG